MSKPDVGAFPAYSRGDRVAYTDRHKRPQIGTVLSMEAHWPAYSKRGALPYVIFTLEHPTYHNRRFYCGSDKITHLLGSAS